MSETRTRVAALVAVGAMAVLVLAGCGGEGQPSPSASTPVASFSASSTVDVVATPSPSATPSAIATPPEPGEVPGRVTTISAGPGGGSGEVAVDWGAVVDATGYRVYRSDDLGGPFELAASFDVGTGTTTVTLGVAYEYIQIWQPSAGSLQYIEVVADLPAYFQVAAFNASGEGPRSAAICGVSMTSSLGC